MLDGAHGDRGIQIQWNSFIIKHQPTPTFYSTDLGQHQREGGAENNLTEDFLTAHSALSTFSANNQTLTSSAGTKSN